MLLALRTLLIAVVALIAPALQAQEQVWLQIEAQPTLDVATERARAYSSVFPETTGFRMRGGWYAVALGPYGVAEGAARLTSLKRENLIPADSFIADGTEYTQQFWPAGGAVPEETSEPAADPDAVVEAPAEPEPAVETDETVQEARASEAALTEDDRKLLQTALQWFGFYDGRIDGAYGKGTRASMAAWQEALGLEATGILTTRQRATLVANYETEVAEYGFAEVVEAEAGIQITLPLALVEFDHYEPPFVHYRAKNGSGLTLVLISQPGDKGTLHGLYDVLQTLEDMPMTGDRAKTDENFTIHGTSASHDSHAFATLGNDAVKGWMTISAPEWADRNARILEVMAASFKSTGTTALDPGMVPMEESVRRGLLSGLDVRKPKFGRSGFFVDAGGTVLTTAEAVTGCGRITIEREIEATVVVTDPASGLAVLKPSAQLSPPAVAEFQLAPDRIGAEVAVAGYSYEDRLPAPVLTWGALEDSVGLKGEAGVKRLSMQALPGDAGGPVVDGSGAVIGVLLPTSADPAQQLPPGVSFAASAKVAADLLTGAGLAPRLADRPDATSPAALGRLATGMTVLVSCWE
jgi:Putative peptidoglycan binding domain/Trypsin-like peptidase domain